jgi:hypothetical protein
MIKIVISTMLFFASVVAIAQPFPKSYHFTLGNDFNQSIGLAGNISYSNINKLLNRPPSPIFASGLLS